MQPRTTAVTLSKNWQHTADMEFIPAFYAGVFVEDGASVTLQMFSLISLIMSLQQYEHAGKSQKPICIWVIRSPFDNVIAIGVHTFISTLSLTWKGQRVVGKHDSRVSDNLSIKQIRPSLHIQNS